MWLSMNCLAASGLRALRQLSEYGIGLSPNEPNPENAVKDLVSFLPVLAYAWIIAGMFFVGMPYLLRDWITWLTQKPSRWKLASASARMSATVTAP